MVPTFGALHAPTAAAARWTAAVAGSLALHGAAAFVLAGASLGAPTGQGSLASHPLQARIVALPPAQSQSVPLVGDRSSPAPPRAASAAAPRPSPDAPQPVGLRESPVYYPPSQLDVRPRLTTRVEPAYPRLAPPDGGYVVLRLLIGEDGSVERALVVLADPEGYFEEAAADAFASARFAPGRRGGIAVRSQLWIEMKFHPLAPPGRASPDPDHAAR